MNSLFRNDSFFPNTAYNFPLYCALQVYLLSFISLANGKFFLGELRWGKRKKVITHSLGSTKHSKILFRTCIVDKYIKKKLLIGESFVMPKT